MTTFDKRKQKKLQMCNLTLNDKGSKNLKTYVNNISGTKIFYLGSLCRCLQSSHTFIHKGEHKAHAMQINCKNQI
jgi:hypothetical protein